MDSLSSLPVECLELILSMLQREQATSTLAALACSNKHIASVTIPVLYNNPYLLSRHIPRERNAPLIVGPENHDHNLTRTLLASHPDFSKFPKILSSAYELHLPVKLTPSPSLWGSLAHVRHLTLTRPRQGLFYMMSMDPPELLTYVKSDAGFDQMLQVQRPLPEAYLQLLMKKSLCHRRLYRQVILFRETFWTLADPIMEQLQSLTIPLSLIERYLGVVARFESLETVDFLMDIMYSFTDEDIDEAARARRAADWRFAARFVQDHTRLFKGVLKTVTYGKVRIWPWAYYHLDCDKEVHMEILKLLPPAIITVLTEFTWSQYIARPMESDLGRIDDIRLLYPWNPWIRGIQDDPLILQQCRSLKAMDIVSPGQGGFRWAVLEKRYTEGLGHRTSSKDVYHGHYNGHETPAQDEPRSLYWQQGLLPLAEVKITEGDMPFTDEVDDIAIGFSWTLESLEAITLDPKNDFFFTSQLISPPHRLFFGRGWVDLPLLSNLVLNSLYGPLAIDSQLFSHCPNLVNVQISDRMVTYKYEDIEAWQLQQPAELFKVQQLSLTGLSALTFHPDTLHTTNSLECLHLAIAPIEDIAQRIHRRFIPPVEEIERFYNLQRDRAIKVGGDDGEETKGFERGGLALDRQLSPRRWSWDWDLPHLTHLTLDAEFAYRFKFRLLQKCPSLEHLALDISTVNDYTHRRTLSIADLFVSKFNNSNGDLSSSQPPPHEQEERIVARSLRSVYLRGQWIMDDAFLQQFLPGMFPSLKNLGDIEYEKNEFTASGLIKVVKETMPEMGYVGLYGYDPSHEEAVALGLNPVPSDEVVDYSTQDQGVVFVQCCVFDYHSNFKLNRST